MDSSAHSSEVRRTEFRLLKPMPSRQGSAADDAVSVRQQPWDTQIRRLFPPRDTPAADLPPVAGICLGHFEIEERIARGGMGTVFRGRDQRLDRIVALKVLSQDQLRDPAAVQRFQNEARAAAKLDHENIARVYFVGEDRGVHFIAFEYVRGTTVREAIAAKGQLSQDEAVNYTLQASEALRHTDFAGVVHRDIKPSNLIVTPSGRVKLVDLGLARQVNPTEDLDLTVTGTTLGTFDYISPEQARDPRNVDIRSDIYSLGCTLYQMLTGSPPYPNGSSVDKLLSHSAGRPPDPCELNPRVSPRLALVVQRMMASNPDERYPSPQALIDELADLAAGLGLRATPPDGTIWRKPLYRSASPWWEENRGWVLAFGVIFLLAFVSSNAHQWVRVFGKDSGSVAISNEDGVPSAFTGENALPPSAPKARASDAEPTSDVGSDPADSMPVGVSMTPQAGANLDWRPEAGTSANRPPQVSPAVLVGANGSTQLASEGGTSPDLQSLAQSAIQQTTLSSVPPIQSAIHPTTTPESGGPLVTTSGAPSTAGTTSPGAATTTVDQSPFVLLSADGTVQGRYQTLEAACHVAKSGTVIEIAHDGPFAAAQKPVLIQGKRLTIRPMTGCRPQLVFAPIDDLREEKSIRMIDVIDGSIELYDVDLAMQVTNNVFADEWVMLSLNRARETVLRRVTVTVANSGWRPAVIIERRMPIGLPSTMMPQTEPMRDAEIQVRDCLFRGNATFYADRTLEPASVRIGDTAIAVDADVMRIDGADRADMETPRRTINPVVRVELDHVTACTRRSIFRLWTESVRDAPDIRVDCRNSILDASAGDESLVRLQGHQDSDLLLQRVRWFGSRNVLVTSPDRHFSVAGLWPLGGDEWSYSFGQWQAQWQPDWELASESVTQVPILSWETGIEIPFTAMQMSDFALRPMSNAESFNPAVGTASDSSDRGFRPSLAPPLPSINFPGEL